MKAILHNPAGFWQRLPRPFFALAPMADVTDAAFRLMFVRYGKPDVLFTEFVSTDGLCSDGRKNVARELQYDEGERPIVAQLWGTKPEYFFKSAQLIAKLGFDGIDINMGCPQAKEVSKGGCAALIKNPKLARELILAAGRGAPELPISVKTRLGYDKIETETWLSELLKVHPAAIILHARTKKEMSGVPAHWGEVARAVRMRDAASSSALIVGNGDITSLEEGDRRAQETGCEGVMVGRGAFGNPWFFSRKVRRCDLPLAERFRVMAEHARIFEKMFSSSPDPSLHKAKAAWGKNFAVMRKHFKAYASGFHGARELRMRLMEADSAGDVERIIRENSPELEPQQLTVHI